MSMQNASNSHNHHRISVQDLYIQHLTVNRSTELRPNILTNQAYKSFAYIILNFGFLIPANGDQPFICRDLQF